MQVRFTQGQVSNLFKEALALFFAKETSHILSGVAERSLCARLAIYLERLLPNIHAADYYADTEYNRKQKGEIKTIIDDNLQIVKIHCDLLVHSRGEQVPDNLIAVEMKKSNAPEDEKAKDRLRLRALTKKSEVYNWKDVEPEVHVSGYIIGIYMELDLKNRTCIFEKYKGGDIIDKWGQDF